jgi:hypothetical protein
MAIVLDHTIVPAKNKVASAEFFAEIFGLTVKPGQGHFAQVEVNESLTFDFSDEAEPRSHHYAFHISEAEFEAIFDQGAPLRQRAIQPHRRPDLYPPRRA